MAARRGSARRPPAPSPRTQGEGRGEGVRAGDLVHEPSANGRIVAVKLFPPGAIFCRTCGYCLFGLPENRCPECGCAFNPTDSKTFLSRPRNKWVKRVLLWGGISLLLLAIAYGSFLRWLYVGWCAEAGARDLDVRPDRVKTEALLPLGLSWLFAGECRQWLEMVDDVSVWYRTVSPQEIASISACRRMRSLVLRRVPLKGKDVAAIARCRELQQLALISDGLSGDDVAPIAALTQLRVLSLSGNDCLGNSALAAAGQLKELRRLCLDDAAITDSGLANLSALANLEELKFSRCRSITDLAVLPLSHLTQLKELDLSGTSLTPAAFERLRQNLPECKVYGP